MSALAQEATFPKADWPGAGGFAPFPCRDHLLGSGGCHPAINTLGELQGQEGQQMGWALPHSPFYLQIKCSPAWFAKVNPACLK